MKKLSFSMMVAIVFLFCAGCLTSSPAQILTTLHSFNGTDGNDPNVLLQATDGNFYGTTAAGGTGQCGYQNGCGTVFKMTPAGTLTTIYNFCSQANCVDGTSPEGGLIQATDGNFYGTTVWGGANDDGTVFKI